jgi:para-nitrobenzyl esterase
MRGTVRVEHGLLRGSTTNGSVWSFKAIPYAAAPVGPLRWRAPQPVPSWEGARPAGDFDPSPMQPRRVSSGRTFVPAAQSEDCLTLNVWTAADDPD